MPIVSFYLFAALQGASLSAEPFPAAPRLPGYAGVRVTIAAATRLDGATLHLRARGGHESRYIVNVPANTTKTLACAVYCNNPGLVNVELDTGENRNPEVRVAFQPFRPMALVSGGLDDAERLSDAAHLALPDIVRIDAGLEWIDPLAIDGFSAIVPRGIPTAIADAYLARGGTAIPPFAPEGSATDLRPADLPCLAVEALPDRPPLPRDAFDLRALAVRAALTAAVLGIVACILVHRRPRAALAWCALLAVGGTLLVALFRLDGPVIVMRAPDRPALTMRYKPATHATPCVALEARYAIGNNDRPLRRGETGTQDGPWLDDPNPRLEASALEAVPPTHVDLTDPAHLPSDYLRRLGALLARRFGKEVAVRADGSRGIVIFEIPAR